MPWIKHGLVYCPSGRFGWDRTHAALPTVDHSDGRSWRVYFAARDQHGRSRIGRVSVDPTDNMRVTHADPDAVLALGDRGTFDDNGTTPSCLVVLAGRQFLYYIGWNPQVTVSYRLAIGLAVSDDGGRTFRRYSRGSILDRDTEEPFFNTAPWVLHDNGRWRMWYASCTGWEEVRGRSEPRYHVKYAESADGIRWQRTHVVCIDYDEFTKAIGRPCVVRDGPLYRMWYSYRGLLDYRTDRSTAYRLGYAESSDGLSWRRRDDAAALERSADGWDSQMLCYAHVFCEGGRMHCFYNGNDFGRTGFGRAVQAVSSREPKLTAAR